MKKLFYTGALAMFSLNVFCISSYAIKNNPHIPKFSLDSNQQDNQDNNEYKRRGKQRFTDEEDDKLEKLVKECPERNWSLIASQMPGKSASDCRSRYMFYIAPCGLYTNWTKQEEELLMKVALKYGFSSAKLAVILPQKSEPQIINKLRELCKTNELIFY